MKVSKLQRLIVASLFCLALCLFPYLSYALTLQDVPNPQQINGTWVTDMANILSDSTETQLNQMISELEPHPHQVFSDFRLTVLLNWYFSSNLSELV